MLDRLCCMRLKTAGYVLGWIDIVGNIASFIFILVRMFLVHSEDENYVVFSLIALAIISTKLQIAILMVLGIKKQRHHFLLPWLTLFGILLIVVVFSSSLAVGFEWLLNRDRTFLFSLLICLLIVFPSWLVGLYIFYGMYSLYKEIQHQYINPLYFMKQTRKNANFLMNV